ncbi:glycosyltransferase [Pseudomonas alloputida]|uniref:glycosyltransferase n=1 Tax=Pseudomonas TaxID=286 RepID=UPI003EECACA7
MSVREKDQSFEGQAGLEVVPGAIATQQKAGSYRIALDTAYYRLSYADLAELSDEDLVSHWHAFGYREGRYASASHAAGDAELASEKSVVETTAGLKPLPLQSKKVELDFYLAMYPDLKANGITTQPLADLHYQRFGKSEGRFPSVAEWAVKNDLPERLIPTGFNISAVLERSARDGFEISPQRVFDTLLGNNVIPLPLDDTPHKTQVVLLGLGSYYLECHKKQQGRNLLQAALGIAPSAEALNKLGSSYMEEGHVSIALRYFEAASDLPGASIWTEFNCALCLNRLHRPDEAIEMLSKGILRNPNHRALYDELDRLVDQKWQDLHAAMLVRVDMQDRDLLIQEACEVVNFIYRAYLTASGVDASNSDSPIPTLGPLGDINTDRVLIVGDFHVPQCVRYRIDQKLEQLQLQGKTATAISWTELQLKQNELALHDVVIFYRVPAVVQVIKAIAQVNATGKLSLYEIDDLLFVPEYPPALESYGGYVSNETYRELTRGMALFNAAARLCRHGIASTEPLRRELQNLVQERRCWLHRNGLDSLNKIRTTDKAAKKHIDIFYGSGTQAHNIDFIEQALPAIERIFNDYSDVRLIVVGYLRLPKAFEQAYEGRYIHLPAIDSVQGYWSLLEQADINIAVLHDDRINSCKSELKWFEAACYGIPSVLSTTENYRDVVKDGEDGYLASSESEWYSALKQLVGDSDLRLSVGQAAQRRATSDYGLEALGKSLSKNIESYAAAKPAVKKKVALVNVFFPPQSIGGATRVVADNFSTLVKDYAGQFDLCVFTADVECREAHKLTVYNHEGCRVYRATTLWREHMDWHPKDPEMYRLFNEFLECEKPDLIHFHCVQRLTASIVSAAKDSGVPYVVTAHDAWWISDFQFLVDHNSKVYPQGHPDLYQKIELPTNIKLADSIERRRDLKELLLGAAEVLTVSNAFAEIYRANGIAEVTVTPNGISDNVQWQNKDTAYSSKVICGHIGGMSEHKGYYLLKEAVLASQPKNIEFLVVDHSKEEGYEHHSLWGDVPVKFIGRVRQEDVVDLYRQIDVLFAPSTWPESFGLVTREAVACGCWVVASDLGGIGEDIAEGVNGYIISPTEAGIVKVLREIDGEVVVHKKTSSEVVRKTAADQVRLLSNIYAVWSGDRVESGLKQ